MGFSPVVARRGYTLVAVHSLVMAVASLVAEHGLWGMQASEVAAHGLSSCGSGALEHRLKNYIKVFSEGAEVFRCYGLSLLICH